MELLPVRSVDRNTRKIRPIMSGIGAILVCLSVLLGVKMIFGGGSGQAAVAQTQSSPLLKAANGVMDAWLVGRPADIPVGSDVGDPLMGRNPGNKQLYQVVGAPTETPTLTGTAFTYTVRKPLPELDEKVSDKDVPPIQSYLLVISISNINEVPTLIAPLSLIPKFNDSGVATVKTDPKAYGLPVAKTTSGMKSQIATWASTFAGGTPEDLLLLTGDREDGQYLPLTGWTATGSVVVKNAWITNVESDLIVSNVQFTTEDADGNTARWSYHVATQNNDAANPYVVAWAPSSVEPQKLVPYMNRNGQKAKESAATTTTAVDADGETSTTEADADSAATTAAPAKKKKD